MGMAFKYTCVGDAGEFSLVKSLDVMCSAIAHTGTEAADHLVYDLEEIALVGYACSDTFGHKFLGICLVALEIAVLRAFFHSLERAHTAV